MTKTDIKTTTYRDGDWMIDIVENGNVFESWLYHEQYAVKQYVLGALKKYCERDYFMERVENNLPTYKAMYAADYFGEENSNDS